MNAIVNQIKNSIDDIYKLRTFTGIPSVFWPEFINKCMEFMHGESGYLLVRETGGVNGWKVLLSCPDSSRTMMKNPEFLSVISNTAEAAVNEKAVCRKMGKRVLFGVRFDLDEKDRESVAVFVGGDNKSRDTDGIISGLIRVSDIPVVYQIRREAEKAKNDVVWFSEALDLMTLLNDEDKYLAAAMTFCNELASRFECFRVSLGWLKKGYVRVQAVSHMEQFEKKMEVVQLLEAAMEEAFDQDEEILFPKQADQTSITRDHERYVQNQDVGNMVSIPIRVNGEPAGVLSCERETKPFTENEVHSLRLICDQASRRLADLKNKDRWFGAKIADAAKETAGRLVGVEHTFAKCVGIGMCLALIFLVFGKWEYRIEAPFILKTDDLAYIPAPFDGYIDKVHVQVGDRVNRNDVLLSLDNQELLLQEFSAIADITRYAGEEKKSGARSDLAEMKIAHALKVQAEAKLDLIRYHLANCDLRAPFPGIVVEGDLKELLGAPVRKGDVLFKVARLEKMYAVLDVDERDIHEISLNQTGEIAFISRPKLKYPIRVELIEPVVVTKEEGNVFPLRCVLSGSVENWWRPGMSGIAKIDVGKRNILWIITHRTVDFFRLLLWW